MCEGKDICRFSGLYWCTFNNIQNHMYSGFHEKFPTRLVIMIIGQWVYIFKNIYGVILVGNTSLFGLTWGVGAIIISEFHFSFLICLSFLTSATSLNFFCWNLLLVQESIKGYWRSVCWIKRSVIYRLFHPKHSIIK